MRATSFLLALGGLRRVFGGSTFKLDDLGMGTGSRDIRTQNFRMAKPIFAHCLFGRLLNPIRPGFDPPKEVNKKHLCRGSNSSKDV